MNETRRQRGQRAKRERIVEAAMVLFHGQGFDETTTEQIAERADVAKGTLFLYAPTKVHLLLLIYEEQLHRLVKGAALTGEGPIVAQLAGVFRPFFELYAHDRALAHRFICEQLRVESGQPGTPALALLLGRLARQIETWQAGGRVAADVDPALAAQTTFAIYFGVLLGWLRGHTSDAERDAQLRAALELHWRGLIDDPRRDQRIIVRNEPCGM
jgi:AcrR family transcriptional regulator